MKYGVVGSQVNVTSRIQSYTTGGQILISETTRHEVGRMLKPGKQMEIKAKGIEHPITLFEVLGIGGPYKLLLPETSERLVSLAKQIPLHYEVLEGSRANGATSKGMLVKISCKGAEAQLETPVPPLSNLKMRLMDSGGEEIPGMLYGKVLGPAAQTDKCVSIRFTSVPPEIAALLRGLTSSLDEEKPHGQTSP
jgi:adenylate cyclase